MLKNLPPPPPPALEDLRAGTKLYLESGISTIIADLDFETYSDAGYVFDGKKWSALPNAKKAGISAVGAARYSEHESTEVICLAYDLKDGKGPRQWQPGQELPRDLFAHIEQGGLLEAWNVSFERWILKNVCIPKYNFPPVSLSQLRCAAAKSRAHGLPSSLDDAGQALNIKNKKLKDGTRLIKKFCCPHNITKKNYDARIYPHYEPEDGAKLLEYNRIDIKAEAELSSYIPDLQPFALKVWLCDQAINERGVAADLPMINACISIIEQVQKKYNSQLPELTGGMVTSATQVARIKKFAASLGVRITSLDKEATADLLDSDIPEELRKVLKIREFIGKAAVKKTYAMRNMICKDGRVKDLFIFHSARTGRAAGAGVQPQNMPNGGPKVYRCARCVKYYKAESCPWCGYVEELDETCDSVQPDLHEWTAEAANDAFEIIRHGSLELLEFYFTDAISTISGCLRGLFIAPPGHDLICSDYSAIEAVCLAFLAGERWRMDVFRTHGKIYEESASRLTGVTREEMARHLGETGSHHSVRKLGKVAELSSGYGGGLGAWLRFGADEFMSEEEIQDAVRAWRKASPAVVELWGGQRRSKRGASEYFGLEGMAILAVLNAPHAYSFRGISYQVLGDALYCTLLSGRKLTYHQPRLAVSSHEHRAGLYELSYSGWNSNPQNGPLGWCRIDTYGGALAENVCQATAFDILANALVNLESGCLYRVVLHVHDEIVAEVREGKGSVQELESIMSDMPSWAVDKDGGPWPVKARGGWRAKRYSK